MTQIIEIDPSLIDHEQNNRRKFDHVPGLAASIAKDGQDQPIVVVAKPDGRYRLISGHSRTMACASLGIKVKAIVRADLDDLGGRLLTLRENDNRQQTNDIEKAIGYSDILKRHPGLTIEDLAKTLGKRVDFVQKRLDLLNLRADLQKLVEDGQLTIGYASSMVNLDHNRQLIAMRHLRDNAAPTVKWFTAVCGELYSQQCQQGLFGWGYSDSVPQESVKVTMPLDPAKHTPSFDLRNPATVKAELELWQAAADGWRQYGKQNKLEACQAIVATLGALLAVLPAGVGVVGRVDSGENETAVKIRGLLLRAGGEATKGWLTRYANETGQVVERTLESMERDGRVTRRTAGRGERWVWAGA